MLKKILTGIGLNLIITMLITTTSFLMNQKFSINMGLENLGVMKLFSQLIAYLSLVDLGLGTASTYALYKPLNEKNFNRINLIISTIQDFYKKISYSVLILGILIVPALSFLIENISINIYIYWCLYVLNTALTYIYAKDVVLLTADQKFNLLRLIQGISKILCQTLQIITIIYFKSFYIFILLMILENLLQYILLKKYYKKNYKYIKIINQRDKSLKKDMYHLFFHKIGGVIVFNTDYILISKFISIMVVGLYSNYVMIYNLIMTILSIITNVINPRIGEYIAKNNPTKVFRLYKYVNIIYLYIAIIFVNITYITINPFVKIWLGKEFLLDQDVVFLIMINLYIAIITNSIWLFKTNSGFFRDIHLPILEGITNLVVSIILVQNLGLKGVIIGTIISNIIFNCILKPILIYKKCFNKTINIYLINYFEITLITLVSIFLLKNMIFNIQIHNWFEWINLLIKVFYSTIIKIIPICLLNILYLKYLIK